MNRPKITEEMIFEAALQVAKKLSGDEESAKTIAQYYCHPMDGYSLARELDHYAGWDFTMSEVEELDAMSSIIDQLQREAEKKWATENAIQPPLPIGTRIKQGIIHHVSEYNVARYCVKEDTCTQKGRYLLIKFEDAVAIDKDKSE